ncbi:MAG TPA: division/cell wall cluster transcriptional repressor MraZ [Burkholderiaceae bacterium]|jgi:MraZ protein|nr:division/cell wall cluster transcriptional repressor MraZ [Burkholderiaceae bacterium]
MAIPARYRDALTKLDTSGASEGGRIVITRSPDGALMLFPRDTWEPFAERVAALPMAAQWHRRLYLGHATEVDMDAAGRVLISAELRRSAGIAGEVKLLGMGNHVEIWDLVAYEQREMAGVRAEQSDAVRNFVV